MTPFLQYVHGKETQNIPTDTKKILNLTISCTESKVIHFSTTIKNIKTVDHLLTNTLKGASYYGMIQNTVNYAKIDVSLRLYYDSYVQGNEECVNSRFLEI